MNEPGYVEYSFIADGRTIRRDVLQIECDPNGRTALVLDAGPGFVLQANRVECQFRFMTLEETNQFKAGVYQG